MGPRQFPQLVIKRYKYVKHRSSQKATYWKCHLYDCGFCKARCTIGVDQTITLNAGHTHKPDIDSFQGVVLLSQESFQVIRDTTFRNNCYKH